MSQSDAPHSGLFPQRRDPALVLTECLRRIAAADGGLNCFTRILAQADSEPSGLDGREDGSGGGANELDGVPFAVKDVFDVRGVPTTAGAALRAQAAPAVRDATVVARLKDAGAILVGTCNMDEFAYGFSTVNAHFGTTRNPHDPARLAGGSSGGSAAAVAAGFVPLALGSDTNGSIRVPAALCGVYGLRPTHGVLPIDGVFPFVESLDVPGPLAGSMSLLRRSFAVMAGRPIDDVDVASLRVARLDGWFRRGVDPELLAGIDGIAGRLGQVDFLDWPEAERARSSAYVLTAAEGGWRHLPALREHFQAFDPATRNRLAAGAALPAAVLVAAQRFRDWFETAMTTFWEAIDVVIAPTVVGVAPRIDEGTIEIDGEAVPARAHLGILTQPISLAGCPVLATPLRRPGKLPLGIQLVAAPGREDSLFALAARLECEGLIGVTPPGAG